MPAEPRFVLHDHRKPSPHFDLRLEEDGVLRSWAVPKGLPEDPAHDRLAIAVDDHELDHIDFEDEHKSVADTGTWQEHDRDERRLVFTLHGREWLSQVRPGPHRWHAVAPPPDEGTGRQCELTDPSVVNHD